MERIEHHLYLMGKPYSEDSARIAAHIIWQEASIEAKDMEFEAYWLQKIYDRFGVVDQLSKFALEISANFRGMYRNYGLNHALTYYGVSV